MHERFGSIFDRSFNPLFLNKASSIVLISILFIYFIKVASVLDLAIYVFWQRTTYISDFYGNSFTASLPIVDLLLLLLTSLWIFLCIIPLKVRIITVLGYIAIGLIAYNYNGSVLTNAIPISSLPLIVFFLIAGGIYFRKTGRSIIRLESSFFVFRYFLLVSLILGITAGLLFLVNLRDNSVAPQANYAFDIYLLVSLLSPILLLLLSFSSVLKMLMNETNLLLRRVFSNQSPSLSKRSIKHVDSTERIQSSATVVNRPRLLTFGGLLACLILSIFIAIVPHLRMVEPPEVIGVDTGYYSKSIKDIVSRTNSTSEAIAETFIYDKGDRSFVLLLLYFYSLGWNSDDSQALDFLPLILAPTLVLAVFLLTREISSNRLSPLIAAFFTAVSGQVLAGIYAGFYANWIALIIGFLSTALMISYLRRPTTSKFLIFSLSFVLLLLSHTYTWSIFLLVTVIFLIISLWRRYYYSRRATAILFIPLIFSVVFDIGRARIIGVSSALEGDMEIAEAKGAGLDQFSERWNNLIRTAQSYLGGLLNNFILFIFALYWIFLADLRKASDIFLIIFLSIGILPLYFGDVVILSRTLYEIPYQIPAAISMAHILSAMASKKSKLLLISTVSVWLLVISVNSIANVTPFVLAK
jgi:hypothetical protein